MARRRKQKERYIPHTGERVMTPDGPGRTIDVNRPGGIIGATIRLEEKELQATPGGGMKWYACRDLKRLEASYESEAGVVRSPSGPLFDFVHVRGDHYEVHKHGCDELSRYRIAGRDIWPHNERTVAAAITNERLNLSHAGMDQEAVADQVFDICKCARRAERNARTKLAHQQKSPDLQGEKSSLQNRKPSSRLGGGSTTNPPSTKRRTVMEKTATTKRRGKAKAETSKSKSTNGNGERRTHEDILELVPEIVKKLKDGTTMTEIRAEYGAGPIIRKALAEKGYNTKGEKIEVEDLSDLSGKKLAKAVADLREEGKAWYYLELATDMSQADLKELLEDNGYGHLAEGRVATADEDEEEEKPRRKSSKGKSSKASSKSEDEDEDDDEETPRRRRRRGKSNPS